MIHGVFGVGSFLKKIPLIVTSFKSLAQIMMMAHTTMIIPTIINIPRWKIPKMSALFNKTIEQNIAWFISGPPCKINWCSINIHKFLVFLNTIQSNPYLIQFPKKRKKIKFYISIYSSLTPKLWKTLLNTICLYGVLKTSFIVSRCIKRSSLIE